MKEAGGPNPAAFGMVGESPAMQAVFSTIGKVAASHASALIIGESGVGKELVAAAIHRESVRRDAPFVPVNCGAVPPELFESELFGHAKGAFTGANADHIGFFQAADGGTLLLDEISELTLKLQVKLLRVVQDKQVYMLGDTKPRSVDVRIMAATSKDLRAMVEAGTFREDLFYRIGVIIINIPPLRARGKDIDLLIRHFAARYSADQGRPPLRFVPQALEALHNYDWPGNVRQLQNVMQRLAVMVEGGEVRVIDLPPHMRGRPPPSHTPSSGLRQVELAHIRAVLDSVGGNKTQAARILGIDRKTLRSKLKGSEPK